MKAMLKALVGGLIGGFSGFLIPFLLAQVYVWRGGDPTAAGVFSFFCFITIPVGIGIGAVVGLCIPTFD